MTHDVFENAAHACQQNVHNLRTHALVVGIFIPDLKVMYEVNGRSKVGIKINGWVEAKVGVGDLTNQCSDIRKS